VPHLSPDGRSAHICSAVVCDTESISLCWLSVQGLVTLCTFERGWEGPKELHISEAAVTALSLCVDAMGRCCGDAVKAALMRQMALLAPVSDHAFMLPVRVH
jgi:hypothetical protein